MRGDERMEERIDAALRSYAEPEEVPEARVVLARVLERARAAESQRRGGWIWGAAVAAGLAVMVLVGMAWVMRGPRRAEIAWAPKAPGVVRQTEPEGGVRGDRDAGAKAQSSSTVLSARLKPCPDTKACSGNAEGARVRVARAMVPEPLPKLDVFPTPRPLSAEEEALVTFVHRAPPAAKKAVIEDQQHWDDPIIVADLGNRPLESGSQHDQ